MEWRKKKQTNGVGTQSKVWTSTQGKGVIAVFRVLSNLLGCLERESSSLKLWGRKSRKYSVRRRVNYKVYSLPGLGGLLMRRTGKLAIGPRQLCEGQGGNAK